MHAGRKNQPRPFPPTFFHLQTPIFPIFPLFQPIFVPSALVFWALGVTIPCNLSLRPPRVDETRSKHQNHPKIAGFLFIFGGFFQPGEEEEENISHKDLRCRAAKNPQIPPKFRHSQPLQSPQPFQTFPPLLKNPKIFSAEP